MAYVIERDSRSGKRYIGVYQAADGTRKSAGTYDSHERAYEIAMEEERHARGFLQETSPADKAKKTISDFCDQRFLRHHAMSHKHRQEYAYVVKNHMVPYIGHLRIGEVNRETFFNLLVKVLPAEEASQVTIRATRKVLSAICQMAFDEGYSSRLNVTTWARPCEMIGFRPCDFDFGQQMLNATRSGVNTSANGVASRPNSEPKPVSSARSTLGAAMAPNSSRQTYGRASGTRRGIAPGYPMHSPLTRPVTLGSAGPSIRG